MFKYFVTDIDHTLFDVEIGIHPENIQTLIKLQEEGITLVLASGRTIESMRTVAHALDLKKYGGYIIGANGTMVQKANEEEPFVQYNHHIDDIHRYIDAAQEIGLHYSIEQNQVLLYSHLDHSVLYERDHCKIEIKPIIDHKRMITQAFPKLCLHMPDSKKPQYLDAFIDRFSKVVYCERFSDSYMDVMPFGHSKLTGIQEILKRNGDHLENVAAIGDGVNDINMLKQVGYSAAVSNAQAYIQANADIIVADVREAGVAQFANLILEKNKMGSR